MSNQFVGQAPSITPVTTKDNWGIVIPASVLVRLVDVGGGGEVTTSTAMHTKVARSSGQSGNTTAGNSNVCHPFTQTSRSVFAASYASTQPTLDTCGLLEFGWNAHGGLFRWLSDPSENMMAVGAATNLCLSCRNSVGVGSSSYNVVWEEP